MSKPTNIFVCQTCGSEQPRWLGKCPDCGGWNTLVEEKQVAEVRTVWQPESKEKTRPQPIDAIETDVALRLPSGLAELDRVLGGGIVSGAAMLLGGDPGIGKSTIAMQLARNVAAQGITVLYVSGEESAQQLQLRGQRLGALHKNILVHNEVNTTHIENEVKSIKPGLLIIDSIQTLYRPELQTAPGSVGQVRECAAYLIRLTKQLGLPTVFIGHVTKDGAIAGPKVLEHMVDTVLYFEGERHQQYRILRAIKNRFGSTNELGIFEMTGEGLIEVSNPSALFIDQQSLNEPGSCVAAIIQGSRPMLVEVQALVSPCPMGIPRRTVTGVDPNRAAIIIAVLEKKAGIKLSGQDIFINVVGGIKIDDPGADLAVALAIASSSIGHRLPAQSAAFGEIGLTGELRNVNQADQRLKELAALGIMNIYHPQRKTTRDTADLATLIMQIFNSDL